MWWLENFKGFDLNLNHKSIFFNHIKFDLEAIIYTYLADVAKTFGSPGLNRTDIVVSVPQSNVFTGWDLIIESHILIK